jgi:hypothetical protein
MNGGRTNVYVDGFNLYYGALKGRGPGYKWLDLELLVRHLLPNNDIGRIRYFTAHVSGRPSDPQLPERQQTYLRALETLPRVTSTPANSRSPIRGCRCTTRGRRPTAHRRWCR